MHILWKYCIFASKFCKYRQLHAKTLISVCPTMFFQRARHQWTNTLKLQSSQLNFVQILPFKTHTKYGAHRQIWPGTNFLHILLWKNDARQNQCKLLMRTSIFQSTLHAKPYMYSEEILHFQRQMCSKGWWDLICYLLSVPWIIWFLKGSGQCLKRQLSNNV